MDLANAMNGVGDAINKAVKMAEPLLFVSGFVLGATEPESKAGQYSGMDLQTQISARVATTLGHMGIAGISTGNGQVSPSMPFVIKPFGWINKYAGIALLGWFYNEVKLPYHTEVFKVLYPLGIGGAVGGVIDPPVPQPGRSGLPAAQNWSSTSNFPVSPIYSSTGQTPQGYGNLGSSKGIVQGAQASAPYQTVNQAINSGYFEDYLNR